MYGEIIDSDKHEHILEKYIPRYSKNKLIQFQWKISNKKNREFYLDNKKYIDEFLKKNPELKNFEFSGQKLEWNCSDASMKIDDKIIQFRPSGVRTKAEQLESCTYNN